MKTEVIVVDDILSAAEEYARLIQLKTNLQTIATDKPGEAVRILKAHPIRVAVVDQKMPEESGTELYRRFKQIDPLIKAIMLTGEADAREVGEALKLGFSDYLHKSNIQELPTRVLHNYTQYEVDLAEKAAAYPRIELYTIRKGLLSGNNIKILLVSTQIIDEEFVFSDSWVTAKQLNAGEQVKEGDKIEITKRFVHEVEGEEKLASTLGFKISAMQQFKSQLESTISSRFKEHTFSEEKQLIEVVREYKLPDEPADPEELHIVSRHFQRAPVYRSIRCMLEKTCECCESKEPFVVLIHQLTSRIATRQLDFLSNGSSRLLLTGVEVY